MDPDGEGAGMVQDGMAVEFTMVGMEIILDIRTLETVAEEVVMQTPVEDIL
jgi:hypothetical protein